MPSPDTRRATHPTVVVLVGFALAISIGSVLLRLPVSHATDEGVGFSDALFTAGSAVTVTGLTVVDTGTVWSPFGEIVVLALIQIGGLGIMTLGGFLGIVLHRRLGLRTGLLAGAEIGLGDMGVLQRLVRRIVVFVAVCEGAVALLLFGHFWLMDDFSPWGALHHGVFHAVSAFNNAGFSTLEGGLERYADSWFVSLVVAGTVIVGGIGFPVAFELRERWRHPTTWTLHTKVTVAVTAALLAAGTALLCITEWTNGETFGPLSGPERVLAAFFHSTIARTAGFNTVPIGSLRDSSLLVLVLLMVIGASSASTGGGIKTTTLAVVVKSTMAEFRTETTTTLFHRTVSLDVQRQALALVVAALGTVGTATFVLTVIHPEIRAMDLLFEASSAFGTVGLSTGVTTAFGDLGRVLLLALMFIGRVGPITFGTAVLLRPRSRRFDYPRADIVVG